MTTPPPTYQPGWYADPAGRYDFHYHNGQSWTNDVSAHGRRMVDGAGGDDDRTRSPGHHRVVLRSSDCASWMPLFFVAGAACAGGHRPRLQRQTTGAATHEGLPD